MEATSTDVLTHIPAGVPKCTANQDREYESRVAPADPDPSYSGDVCDVCPGWSSRMLLAGEQALQALLAQMMHQPPRQWQGVRLGPLQGPPNAQQRWASEELLRHRSQPA